MRWIMVLVMSVVVGGSAAAPAAALQSGIATALSAADGREVDVVYNGDRDEVVAIWVQDEGTGEAIWAQRFTGAGEAIGVAKSVASTGGQVSDPAIEYVPQFGLYYLAWIDPGPSTATVIGKRITFSLSNQGGPFAIAAAGGNADPDAGSVDLAQRWGGNMWVVYDFDPTDGTTVDDEHEIYRKIYSPSRNVVDEQLRISQAGTDGDAAVDAEHVAIAWSDRDRLDYLVAWVQQGQIWGQVHYEVHGAPGVQRDDFAIAGVADGADPAIAYSEQLKQWLVVYTAGGHVYARVVHATTGYAVSAPIDVSAGAGADASHPSVTWNAKGEQWLVAWSGTSAIAPGEREIHLQALRAQRATIDGDDHVLRMSVTGPGGDLSRAALAPAIVHSPVDGHVFTAWQGDHEADDVFKAYITLGSVATEPAPPLFPPPGPGPAVLVPPDPNRPPDPSPPGQLPPTGGAGNRSSAGLAGGTTIDLPAGATSLGVTVACTTAAACAGTLTAETAKAYASAAAAAKKKAKAKRVVLGTTRFALKAGARKTVRVKLTAKARRLLAHQRTLKVRLTLTIKGSAPVHRTVTVRRRR
jgi:hypothetical protein